MGPVDGEPPCLSSGGSCIQGAAGDAAGPAIPPLLRTFDINEFVEIVPEGLHERPGGRDHQRRHGVQPKPGERRKDGIKGLVCRNCLNDEGRVSSPEARLAQLTQFWQLQWVGADDSEAEETPATTPGRTGAAAPDRPCATRWSPWRLEDFDTIPQALLLAKILRSLGRRRDIEDVYATRLPKMAHHLGEGIAHAGPPQHQGCRRDTEQLPDHGAGHACRSTPSAATASWSWRPRANPAASSSSTSCSHPERRRPLRAHEKRTGAPASRACALRQGGRKQQKQPEESSSRGRGLSPLAELLRFRMHVTSAAHQLRAAAVLRGQFQMGRAFSVGEIICYLTLLGFLNNSTVHNPFQRYWSLVLLTTTCLVYWGACSTYRWCWRASARKLQDDVAHAGLLPFLFILFVLMFGFGVTFHARNTPRAMSIQSTGTEGRESASEIILGMFRNTFYGHRGRILLLNVIVAMFSKTIDAIDSESKAMCAVREVRPYRGVQHQVALPPPFNILSELRKPGVLRLAPTVPPLRRRARAARRCRCCRRGRARIPQPPRQPGHPHDCQGVPAQALYYQALAFRNRRFVPQRRGAETRRTWTKQQRSSSSSVNALNERMERFDRIEETVKQLESLVKELKAISLRGPSNISNKRASVLAMPYIEEGREEGPA
uniref:DUF202 domain-containing protein n=1 Tax=Macrostomum lignano TaxID=282301 RepID=A0A1I8FAA7_9PLAT